MKKLIVGNLKMNLQCIEEREKYLSQISELMKQKKMNGVEMVLCAPFVHLEGLRKWRNKKIVRGAQDVFWENEGSFTGEISPVMLKNFGCEYVIIGHSERRKYFGENEEMINGKIRTALDKDLISILCVGETKTEKDNDQIMLVITNQLKGALQDIEAVRMKMVVIAYEPVWSIGTGELPSTNEIMGAKLLIRKVLYELFGKEIAEEVRILYGGSVNAETVNQVCLEADMNGVLVGKESLNPTEFVKIAGIISDNT